MITYEVGDAIHEARMAAAQCQPVFIVHGCNDIGAWGAGFTAALDRVWPDCGRQFQAPGPRPLGSVSYFVPRPESYVAVANCVTQHGTGVRPGQPIPFRYDALSEALTTLATHLTAAEAWMPDPPMIYMPRIGCGLAGATWDLVGPFVERLAAVVDVTVWDLPSR